tara:strand:+ start:337 stop:705 length:369 start_codon:yes stop_codon:yes gene_type:complete
MATFPNILPLYGSQEVAEQEFIQIKLGDGYQQRLVHGLPANKRLLKLSLTFNVSTVESKTINDFLNDRFEDQASFDVSSNFRQKVFPDLSVSPKFICISRSRSRISNNRITFKLSFEEVAEP